MNNTKTAIFITIYRILVKGKKHYCKPSVQSILELIAARHKTTVKSRWAFQCLADIEQLGYITRHERYTKLSDGTYKQKSSMITITLRGARKLFDMGIEGAAKLVQDILNWLRGTDKRWPDYKPNLGPQTKTTIEGGLVNIGNILASLGAVK